MSVLFLNPDTIGKNGKSLRNAAISIVQEFKCTEIQQDICRGDTFKRNVLAPQNPAGFNAMDLAATISENNLDSITTVEEVIANKGDKKTQRAVKQPKVEQQNDTDYKELKQYRKNYKESVKTVKANERQDLKLHALYVEEKMLAEHAARREERRANEKTDEQKEEARKFYAERREIVKKREALRNGGNLGPLDFENNLTLDKRLRFYNKHHKCVCGKRYNIIFKGKEGYIARCSHRNEVVARVSNNRQCLHCGSSKLEIHINTCKCKNYFCQRCKGSNYFYKDVEEPESKILCTAHQIYDCHPGGDVTNDLHFTVKLPDYSMQTTEGDIPVLGEIKDLIIKQSLIVKDVVKPKTYKPKNSRKEFLKTLQGDIKGFNWAERVTGVKTNNSFSALGDMIEEPQNLRVEASEEQGGMVSTAMATSKTATISAYTNVRSSIEELLKKIRTLKDRIMRTASIRVESIIRRLIGDRFDSIIFILELIYEHFDFEVCGHLAFILARCYQQGTFKWSSILTNVAQLGMIAYHIGVKTEEQLEKLANAEMPMPKNWVPKYKSDVQNQLDAAILISEGFDYKAPTIIFDSDEEIDICFEYRQKIDRVFKGMNLLWPIVQQMMKDQTRFSSFIEVVKSGDKYHAMFNKNGLAFIKSKTIASMLKIIGEVPQSGDFGLEGLCDCIKTTFHGLFSGNILKEMLKLFRDLSPLFLVYRGGKEIVKDIANAIATFIFGEMSPVEWLDKEMYNVKSPVHELYSIYLAYVSTTVPGSKQFVKMETSEMRTAFYQAKQKCDLYVEEKQKWSTKYASWLSYMERGLATPPQPKEREYEPTVLVLYGAPGVGKSTIWPHIAGYVLGITPKKVREVTHTWNGASEYQPGMADKRIVLFDDFGQDRTKNEETLNLIRLCTAAPFMVNSANITGPEIKGMFAQPEMIVICTNDEGLATDKVFSGAAVIRRMDLYLTMEKKLDFNKADVANDRAFHVYQCGRYPDLNDKKLSLADVSGLTKVIHYAKIDSYKKVNKDLEIVFDKIDLEAIIKRNKEQQNNLPAFIIGGGDLSREWEKYIDHKPGLKVQDVIEERIEKKKEFINSSMSASKNGKTEVQTIFERDRKSECDSIRALLKKYMENKMSSDNVVDWFNKAIVMSPLCSQFVADEIDDLVVSTKGVDQSRAIGLGNLLERKKREYKESNRAKTSEDSQEESMSFPYLVSLASKAIVSVVNFSTALVLPSYVMAAYFYLVADMADFFKGPSIGGFFKTVVKTLSIAIGGVTLAWLAYKAVYRLNKSVEDTEESGTTRTAKAVRPTLTVNSVAQSGNNDNIVQLVKRNSGTLIAANGRQINCVAIGGTWVLTAMHFFADFTNATGVLREGTEIAIVMSTGAQFVNFKFERQNLVQFENNTEMFDGAPVRPDVVLYKIDHKLFPSFKNIMHHFWDGSYNTKNLPVVKVDFYPDLVMGGDRADLAGNLKCDFKNSTFEICSGMVEEDQVMTVRTKGFDRYYHCVATATYKGRDKSCGSIVMRTDCDSKPILGIHVAAVMRNGHSMFHFVTAAELMKATAGHVNVALQESSFVQYGQALKYESDLPDNNQFYYLGTTDKKHRVFQPIKTDLQPSLLYECIHPHMTEPSLLHKDDPRIPEERRSEFWPTMMEGYANYTNLTFEDVQEAVESVIVDTRRLQHKKRASARVLTDHEVLNGSTDFSTLGRVPMDTSCGWPYSSEGKKKTHLIEEIEGELYMKERLFKDWKDAERCLEDGIVPFLPFTATIKDERVKLKKIYDTPKSRIFMAGNVVNYMLNRKYYGWLMDMYTKEQWTFAVVSLDRVSVEWHYFISSMIEVGPMGFDGDFKWWDKFINCVLKYCAFLVGIDGLATSGVVKKDSPKYCALRELKMRPVIIFGEAVYLANGIEPSGDLLTLLDNCIMNEVIHRTAYLQITKKLSPMDCSISVYRAKTRGGRVGDDTMQMVHASIIEYFNGKTFAEWCQSKNISITGADKTDTITAATHFKSLQFVKNTTGVMYGYYVPQQDISELVEMAYWVRLNANNKDIVKATEDNTNAALRGIYYWGKDKFNEMRNIFLARAPQLNLLSWADLDLQWKSYGYFPGSHSDYATKTDQDIMRRFNPTILSNKSLMREDVGRKYGQISHNIREMKILESQEEAGIITGIDKASINSDAMHPSAGLDERIPIKDIDSTPPATTSNVLGSESQVNGAFIQSKEEPVRQQLRTGKIMVSPADFRAQGHLNDKNWTLAKLASKFTSLGQISWPISAAPGTVLKKWNLPNDVLTTPALKTPFDVTAYERFQSITFKITTSASPFYAGRLICGFFPRMQFEPQNTNPSNLHLTLTQLGGVVINPTDNQTVEFSIPYRHYLNWLEYPKDYVGQFYIVVMNSLKTGAANINNVTISAFVSIENAQFKVPEYVGPVTKSQLYVETSRPQSGDADTDDTSIVISKRVNTVNEDFQSNATMMCAGTGLYVEPTVKQFPDHPIDLVQLLKRDNLYAYENFEIPPGESVQPGFSTILYPYDDVMRACTREVGDIFGLFRGSLMMKASFFAYYENQERSDSWEGKVYFINQDLPVSYGGSVENYNYFAKLNLGYHKFDQNHPACLTVPHWSPNFVSFNRGEPTVNENPVSWIVFEFYNWSLKPLTIRGCIEARVDDDFSMGVFLGMPAIKYSPVPVSAPQAKKKYRTGPKHTNDGFVVIPSKYQGGNIMDTAQDWVTGKAQDIASGIVKAGVDSVFDLARENLEPVMDIVDMVGNLLDAPPITLQAAPYMPRKWNYGNANNIMQYTEKLGATNHNGGSYTDKSAYGTNQIETNLYHLCTDIKTLWKTISWPTSAAAGTLLNYFSVGLNGTEDVLNNNSKVATPMDSFARFFNYWSGSIIYAMDVVSSQMHTGRLVVSFHPNLTGLPSGFSLDQATQQYFLSFDLDKGKGCAVMEIPYLFKRPFKPIPLFDSVGTSQYPFADGFNGIVCIWVMNPLRASETVSNSVEINLYKMAGKDFRFEGYGNTLNASMTLN